MTTLRDPFATIHKKDIKNKQGIVVAQVDYVGWSQIADRLDDAEPGWSFSIMSLGEDWCHGRLTFADGRHFENVGYAENADMDWKKEVLKDAVSDAFKRCAALAGASRYLYDKDAPRPTTQGAVLSSTAPGPVAAGRSAPRPAAPTVPPEPDYLAEAIGGAPQRPQTADDEGTCPVHHKAWKENTKGFYCSSKNADGSWCDERPTQRYVQSRGVGVGR